MNNEEKILALLEQVVADVSDIKTDVTGLKTDVSGLKTDVSGLKTDVADLKAGMTALEVRVDETAALAQKTAVLLETEVARKINLLYEGHETIMDKLDDLTSTKSRVEVLEADMALMKDAYKLLRQEVNELKKAQ